MFTVETFNPNNKENIQSQLAIDALSDLLDVPLALLRQTTADEIFEKLNTSNLDISEKFQTPTDIYEFFSSAASIETESVFKQPLSNVFWRDFFRSIEGIIFATRPQTSDLLFYKLRRHWAWRWREVFFLARVALRIKDADIDFGNLDKKVFNRSFSTLSDLGLILHVGPTKKTDDETSGDLLNLFSEYLVEFEADILSSHSSLKYDIVELGAHFTDRYGLNLFETKKRGQKTISVIKLLEKISESCVTQITHELIRSLVIILYSSSHFKQPQKAKFTFKEISCSRPDEVLVLIENPTIQKGVFSSKKLEEFSVQLHGVKIRFTGHSFIFKDASFKHFKHSYSAYVRNLGERINTKETLRLNESMTLIGGLLNKQLKLSYDTIRIGDIFSLVGKEQKLEKLAFQLSRIIARVISADGVRVYFYNRADQELILIGGYVEGLRRKSPLKPEDIIRPLNSKRQKNSLTKRAIFQRKTQIYTKFDEYRNSKSNALYDWSNTVVQPKENSTYPKAISAISAPILINQRSWGVIEVASSNLAYFGRNEISSLIKIAEMIGSDLHGLNVNRLFNDLASEIYENNEIDTAGHQKNLNSIASRVSDLFLGSTAAIWIRDTYDTQEFKLLGFAKSRDDKESKFFSNVSSYRIDDGLSNTSTLFDSKQKAMIGVFGEGSFDQEWADSSDRRARIFQYFKSILIIGLYDQERGAIGSISIYFEEVIFGDQWLELGNFVSDYASTIVKHLLGVNIQSAGRLALDQHEINNNVLFTKSKIENAVKEIGESLKGKEANGLNLSILKKIEDELQRLPEDTSEYLDQIKAIGSKTNDRSRKAKQPLVYSKLSEVGHPKTWTNIREIINTCFKALEKRYPQNGVIIQVDYSQLNYLINAHSEDLRTIFINLSSNALKHSAKGSTVRITSSIKQFQYTITVRNIGRPISVADQERLFFAEFQASNAKLKNTKGKGLGLFIARQMCEEYQFELNYSQSEPFGNNLVWHNFSIDIPIPSVTSAD